MWRNYLTVGLRALAKNRVYAAINIAGLALGIAACLLILGFVRYEFTYDSWLPDSPRTYQFQSWYRADAKGGEEMKLQMTSYPAGQALKKDFPDVEYAVYAEGAPVVIKKDGVPQAAPDAVLTDGPLFRVLAVPFVHGDPVHALDDPNSVVFNRSEALRLFGTDNPVGQTVTIVSGDLTADYRITGVFEDLPKNSSMKFKTVARFVPEQFYANSLESLRGWNNQNGAYFVRLRPGADPKVIEAGFPAWKKRNIPDENDGLTRSNPGDNQDFKLVNIRDVHLGEAQMAARTPGNDVRAIVTFGVIAVLILGMACVNFTNLATARASQRAREVALRKVLGATRTQLIQQFIGESMMLAAIAMLVALAIVELTLPALNAFLDAQIDLRYFQWDGLLLPAFGLTLVVGLAGGVYPAFVLSRFEPARVLKANKSAADAEGSGKLRNMLVVAQFAVSIGLIICTAVVYAQTVYARNVDAGFRRDGLLQIEGVSRPQVEALGTTLVDQLKRVSGVTAVGRTQIAVDGGRNSVTTVRLPGKTDEVALGHYGIDPGFFDTMGIKLIAGRNFAAGQVMDDATTPQPLDPVAERGLVERGINIVVSESAAARLGFADARAAVGKQIMASLVLPEYGLVPATIVGVVADARFRSVRDPLQPIFYYGLTNNFGQYEVRFEGVPPKAAFDSVEAVWKRLVPDIPFRGRFVDDIVLELYTADAARAQLFGAFALLAVVIGCLGLFGLAAFTAERRTKEIGIRKVLGARTRDIVRLLVWQFSRPVLIANIIAWPAAWWVMRDWLNGFDSRIALTPVPFVLAGGVALVIAVVTIGSHAIRVARTSPVRALRYE